MAYTREQAIAAVESHWGEDRTKWGEAAQKYIETLTAPDAASPFVQATIARESTTVILGKTVSPKLATEENVFVTKMS